MTSLNALAEIHLFTPAIWTTGTARKVHQQFRATERFPDITSPTLRGGPVHELF
jgi:hypothetical protein